MPFAEGMDFLDYAMEKEREDFLTRRWMAPIHSMQSYQTFAEFKEPFLEAGGGKTESAGEILDRVERMMDGRVVNVNGTV